MTDLTRRYVEAVIEEEAARACVSPTLVIGRSNAPEIADVRLSCFNRIMKATGCTAYRLAKIWGLDTRTVTEAVTGRRYVRRTPPCGPPAPYDARTLDRLTWAHGTERAAEIVAGRDAAANADLAAWRRLGADR